MAEVLPFKGVRFNPKIVSHLASVLCPPYDLIAPEDQRAYEQKSPYNIVRLEKPEKEGYQIASSTFQSWLKDGVLIFEQKEAFYIHQHSFDFQGRRFERLELIAIVKADKSQVLPHENTLPQFIPDRLNLLRSCQANFSPIMAIYQDQGNKIIPLLTSYINSAQPILEIDNKEAHKLWRLEEAELIACLSHLFLSRTIYIADGHHRFRTALLYREENPAAEYVLMTLIEASQTLILPVHRLLSGVTKEDWNKFKQELVPLFKMKAFSSLAGLRQALSKGSIGVYFDGEAYLLTPSGKSSFPSTLHLLHELLLPRLSYRSLSYITEFDTDISGLNLTTDKLLFLVSPLMASEVMELAQAKITLPGKATYFYPKTPAGLVFYKYEAFSANKQDAQRAAG